MISIDNFRPSIKTLTVMFYDVIIIMCSYYASYALRFNSLNPKLFSSPNFYSFLLITVIVQFLTFYAGGVYRAVLRFSSLPDLIRIIRSVTLAVPLTVLAFFFWNRLENVPRTTFIIDWCLLIIGLGGGRFAYRNFREYLNNFSSDKVLQNVLIIGAGNGGVKILREIKENPDLKLKVVGFLDDDPSKTRRVIHGVTVFGSISVLGEIARLHSISKVFIAIPSAGGSIMRRIVSHANDLNLEIRTLPKMSDILNGRISLSLLRNLEPEDLLGRESIKLDFDSIKVMIEDKVVLVTGAGGSIGRELCKQICLLKPQKIILFELTEFFLYELEMNLTEQFPELEIYAIIGDVRNKSLIENVISSFKPSIIFHAAAYKHVPIMEKNPKEAIRTNIFGTKNVAEVADKLGVERFILISTDKAINPTNVMGASKRVAEQICQFLSHTSKTKFITVRFGNVLDSSGSVVPLFKKQIEKGGPVTITHPEITRYIMSIPEASQLVMQAGALGNGGEVFVLDMGEPIKIINLAKEMIKLSGLKLDEDIEIKFTGLRPGEKLFEELFFDDEHSIPTSHSKIRIAKARQSHPDLYNLLSYLDRMPEDSTHWSMKEVLQMIVPEYSLSGEDQVTQLTD